MGYSIAFCSDDHGMFFREVREGVREEVNRHEDVHLCQWQGSFEIPLPWVDVLRADAVVAGPCSVESLRKRLGRFPLVGCSNAFFEASWPLICNDDAAAGRAAASAMADRGYDSLLAMVSHGGRVTEQRLAGVRAFAGERGLPLEILRLSPRPPTKGEDFKEVWVEHLAKLRSRLRKVPDNTGIIVPTPAFAMEILGILRSDLRRAVPQDIGLVMVDLPNVTERPLAHVQLAAREIGRRCARQLLHRLEDPDFVPPAYEAVAPEGVATGSTLRVDEAQDLVHKLETWCQAHLREDLSVEDMARAVGLSRRSLEMKLKGAGLSAPHRILIEHRLREAQRLLQTTALRMEDLAEACGFRSARALSKSFTSRYGLSPMQWKKRHPNP
jgi:AraC-like DNA-binding protein